jgi:hypothetical protein
VGLQGSRVSLHVSRVSLVGSRGRASMAPGWASTLTKKRILLPNAMLGSREY